MPVAEVPVAALLSRVTRCCIALRFSLSVIPTYATYACRPVPPHNAYSAGQLGKSAIPKNSCDDAFISIPSRPPRRRALMVLHFRSNRNATNLEVEAAR